MANQSILEMFGLCMSCLEGGRYPGGLPGGRVVGVDDFFPEAMKLDVFDHNHLMIYATVSLDGSS